MAHMGIEPTTLVLSALCSDQQWGAKHPCRMLWLSPSSHLGDSRLTAGSQAIGSGILTRRSPTPSDPGGRSQISALASRHRSTLGCHFHAIIWEENMALSCCGLILWKNKLLGTKSYVFLTGEISAAGVKLNYN